MDLIDERALTHGPFWRTAEIYADLQIAIGEIEVAPEGWAALDMILMKIARIAGGDPHEPDHWRDIAGYAELVVRSLGGGK